MQSRVLVVDLDETLLKINTFHKWLVFLVILLLKQFKVIKLMILVVFLGLRFLRIIHHSRLKKIVLRTSCKLPDKYFHDFSKEILKYKNDLDKYLYDEAFDIKILATAAPEFYSKFIAKEFNFDVLLATKCPSQESIWVENIRNNKLESVRNYLKSQKLAETVDTLITDHKDDLPLMQIAQKTILVNPKEETLIYLEKKNIHTTIIQV